MFSSTACTEKISDQSELLLQHMIKKIDLSSWLSVLEQRHPLAIDLGLDRVNAVAKRLDLTSFSCPVITVAGTNGKGSTVATLQALALAHGLNVGVYTSPHLLTFNERIAINGVAINDESLLAAFEFIEQGRGDISLTYFEFTTLAAFAIFKQKTLDLIVLEVGMGGRLDAVNIIDADVAVITTIAKDHEAFLGDTVTKIAAEKAGICRTGKPVVIGDSQQVDLIGAAVAPYQASVIAAGVDYHWSQQSPHFSWHFRESAIESNNDVKLGADLIATGLTAFRLALPSVWRAEAVISAIESAQLIGRWQTIASSPQTVVDIGHNPQAAQRLATRARAIGKSLHLVVGMLADKDQQGSLSPFFGANARWYLSSLTGSRACSAQTLADKLPPTELAHAVLFDSPRQAWHAARLNAQESDLILVWGSFLTVADVVAAVHDKKS